MSSVPIHDSGCLILDHHPDHGTLLARTLPRELFAFVAPEVEHVHQGFEYGIWMDDPDKMLSGAHLKLRKVRFVTYQPGDPIPEPALVEYTRDAARLARMLPEERLARALDRD